MGRPKTDNGTYPIRIPMGLMADIDRIVDDQKASRELAVAGSRALKREIPVPTRSMFFEHGVRAEVERWKAVRAELERDFARLRPGESGAALTTYELEQVVYAPPADAVPFEPLPPEPLPPDEKRPSLFAQPPRL